MSVTTYVYLNCLQKDILTLSGRININETRQYFLEILVKLIFEEVVCEAF